MDTMPVHIAMIVLNRKSLNMLLSLAGHVLLMIVRIRYNVLYTKGGQAVEKENNKCRWFKAELRSYFYMQPIIKDLKDKLTVLDNKLEYHSPNLSGMHGVPQDHDEKLAHYITIRERYSAELDKLIAQQKRTETILNAIPEEYRETIIAIYSESTTIPDEAERWGYSIEGLRWRIQSEIMKAIKLWEESRL